MFLTFLQNYGFIVAPVLMAISFYFSYIFWDRYFDN